MFLLFRRKSTLNTNICVYPLHHQGVFAHTTWVEFMNPKLFFSQFVQRSIFWKSQFGSKRFRSQGAWLKIYPSSDYKDPCEAPAFIPYSDDSTLPNFTRKASYEQDRGGSCHLAPRAATRSGRLANTLNTLRKINLQPDEESGVR